MSSRFKGNDWFTRQQRLADQERMAMRDLLRITEGEPKREQSYDPSGSSRMPGVVYDEGGIVDKILDILKIKPRKGRYTKPTPAGRSGFI